jgi:hypothetical protein
MRRCTRIAPWIAAAALEPHRPVARGSVSHRMLGGRPYGRLVVGSQGKANTGARPAGVGVGVQPLLRSPCTAGFPYDRDTRLGLFSPPSTSAALAYPSLCRSSHPAWAASLLLHGRHAAAAAPSQPRLGTVTGRTNGGARPRCRPCHPCRLSGQSDRNGSRRRHCGSRDRLAKVCHGWKTVGEGAGSGWMRVWAADGSRACRCIECCAQCAEGARAFAARPHPQVRSP